MARPSEVLCLGRRGMVSFIAADTRDLGSCHFHSREKTDSPQSGAGLGHNHQGRPLTSYSSQLALLCPKGLTASKNSTTSWKQVFKPESVAGTHTEMPAQCLKKESVWIGKTDIWKEGFSQKTLPIELVQDG